jgi:hypothetical protein
MKSLALLLFTVLITTHNAFAQLLPKKPSRVELGSYNQSNLLKIDLGITKTKLLEVMGGIKKIQTYTSTSFMTKKESIIINNPVNREFKTDSAGNTVELIWYYTNVNKAEGEITKEQQTPIILEKNAVVGMGWDFYEQYAKRRGITIEPR